MKKEISLKMTSTISVILFLILTQNGAAQTQSSKYQSGLRFLRVGSIEGIVERFGTNVYKTIEKLSDRKKAFDCFLISIAEQPLTKQQISESSNLSPFQVAYFISKLDSVHLIKKDSRDRWATTVPVITDQRMKVIRADITPMANRVEAYLEKETPQLRKLYSQVKSHQDPSWEVISHLIIDKFIVDGTFHSRMNKLKRERDISKSDDQHRPKTPAFFLEHGEHFSNFGTNWYAFNEGDDQREVYVLHGAAFDRSSVAMNRYRGDAGFASVIFNITPEGGIQSLTNEDKGMLKYLDWIEENRLLVPVVQAKTIKSLWPVIEKIGQEAAEVAFQYFPDIVASSKNTPHDQFLEDNQDYIQVCYHTLFGVIIEQLVKNGVVSPIPKPVPESFGVYFVFGKLF